MHFLHTESDLTNPELNKNAKTTSMQEESMYSSTWPK